MCHAWLTIFPQKYSWAAVSLFDVDDEVECPLILFVVSEAAIQNHFSCVVPNCKFQCKKKDEKILKIS